MQLELTFKLSFDSDWHINAGFGADGKADAVIERDPQGKPIISGTTLKGVFRDALYDLALNLKKDTDAITGILGAPGRDSCWRFSAASSQARSIRDSMIATGVRVDPRYRRAEDNKYFQRELGAAENFTFMVAGLQVNDEAALEHVEWLVAAAAYIERIGGRRRRGTGKCKISLEDHNLHNEILNSFENRHFRETHQISSRWKESLIVKDVTHNITSHHNASHRYRIMLYTERPVVIAEKPEAGNVYQGQIVIPGSTLRGALANLARPEVLRGADAAMYAEFKRFFVHGELKLSHLNPIEVSNGLGTPVAQIPMGLQQIEGSPDCCFTSVFQQLSKEKSFSGWIRLQNGLQKATYNTEPHPHVRINPDLKRASDGDLYTYEAIPAGRFYGGELYLKDNDWKSIGELLRVNINEPFELQIGKGRNRSYGQVRAVIVPMTEDEPPAWIHVPLEVRLKMTPANVLYITLATDSILQDQWGRFYGRFEEKWLAAELEAPDVQIMVAANDERPDQVVRTRLIESFDARSGLPRWRDKALLAGSTACLVFADGKRPSLDILKRLETTGVGVRRDEGFGRVIFNHPAHTGNWSGFANAIAIPQKLLDSVPAAPVEETQQAFDQRWKEKISRSIRGTVSEPICRSLAIQMMEYLPSNHSTDQQAHHSAVESLIESLKVKQVATDQSQKALYQEYKTAVDTITKLLEEIKNEQQHWRKAVILLAEALMNNREKA